MKVAENTEFLVVDTEDENKPFSRIYVFFKNIKLTKTYGKREVEDNLYSAFIDDPEKRIAELCKESGII